MSAISKEHELDNDDVPFERHHTVSKLGFACHWFARREDVLQDLNNPLSKTGSEAWIQS